MVRKLDTVACVSIHHRNADFGDNRSNAMQSILDPFGFVLISLSGWMNQRQLHVIDYLREENRVLREQLGGRRLRLNDDQRRRLAVKGKASFPIGTWARRSQGEIAVTHNFSHQYSETLFFRPGVRTCFRTIRVLVGWAHLARQARL